MSIPPSTASGESYRYEGGVPTRVHRLCFTPPFPPWGRSVWDSTLETEADRETHPWGDEHAAHLRNTEGLGTSIDGGFDPIRVSLCTINEEVSQDILIDVGLMRELVPELIRPLYRAYTTVVTYPDDVPVEHDILLRPQ